MKVIPIKNSGVSFLSTTQVCSDVLEASRKVDIPVLCGVSSLMEARQALKLGALGLKFYPSSAVSPTQLSSILYHLNKENREYTSQLIHDDSSLMSLSSSKRNVVTGDEITSSSADRLVYILVAGGVTPESAIEYTRAGATHFCIGYDCRVLSPTDILSSIQLYENALLLC